MSLFFVYGNMLHADTCMCTHAHMHTNIHTHTEAKSSAALHIEMIVSCLCQVVLFFLSSHGDLILGN